MGKFAEFIKRLNLIPSAYADTGSISIVYIRNRLNDNGRFTVSGADNDKIVMSIEQITQNNPRFIYPGYEFVEWNTKADGTGISYAAGSTNSEYTRLYAIWEKGNTFYTVNHGDMTDVADAIRNKTGGSNQIVFPTGFESEIGNLSNTSDADAEVGNISWGKTAYINGGKVIGTQVLKASISSESQILSYTYSSAGGVIKTDEDTEMTVNYSQAITPWRVIAPCLITKIQIDGVDVPMSNFSINIAAFTQHPLDGSTVPYFKVLLRSATGSDITVASKAKLIIYGLFCTILAEAQQ